MARRRYARRKVFKVRLRKTTIYTLFAIGSIAGGAALLISYTKSNEVLATSNLYLTSYFGSLSILVPINLVLFGLLLTRIRASFTRPNIFFGFVVLSASLIGLFQSGQVGERLFALSESIFGTSLSLILYVAAVVVGLVVFLNLSIGQIYQGIVFAFKLLKMGGGRLAPLFKTKKGGLETMKQITIKGLRPEPALEPHKSPQKAPFKNDSHELVLNKPLEMGVWEYPPISLLSTHTGKKDTGDVKKIAAIIERTFQSFGIQARVVEINVGPSVTQYAIEIALGTKLSRVTALTNDLALATEAPTGQIRIEAPIPGRNLVGIEIPNRSLEIVSLKAMLESPQMEKAKSKLAVPLGLDVSGTAIIADIARMPHILIAGTTGSGKSVLVNSIIASMLFRSSPNEVKMIMIDPKRVELTGYSGIPHLLAPVVVEAEKSISALKWAMKEMDRRYVQFQDAGVKNIDSFNELSGFQALPYIVIFIDELADLMVLAPVEVEDCITRLAQMARATGIHLILSTQRPSVDILTGLIKANIPSRIAFNVASMIDSKVIIDQPGAEKLLGRGDMLFVPPDQAKPTRIQGTYVSEQDIKRLVNFIKSRGIPVKYTTEVLEQKVMLRRGIGARDRGMMGGDVRDELFEQAVKIVCMHDKASSSLLQRRLSIGFNRAARILEQLEEAGVVGPGEGSKPRDVLIRDPDQFLSQQ